MNHYKEALQKIVNSPFATKEAIINCAKEALEQSEPQEVDFEYERIKLKVEVVISATNMSGNEKVDAIMNLLQPKSERNQTEAEKESDWEQFIIDQINQSYNEYKGSNEAVQDAAYFIAKKIESKLLLARKQVIEEIEEWVKENTESVENQSGDRGGAIWTSELLTKLQTLKP